MKLVLPFIEAIVTTKCNLRCNDCSNLIPLYQESFDVPCDVVCRSIDALLECVDELTFLKIHGGEPCLSEHIDQILSYASGQEKVRKILVPTNGSFVPNDTVMALLRTYREKVKLVISNYEACRDNHRRLLEACEAYGVDYSMSREKAWYSFGAIKNYHEPEEVQQRRFAQCEMKRFSSLYWGKLYACSRIAHGVHLGLMPRQEEWEFDLLKASGADRKGVLSRFLSQTACGYCGYCTMDNIRDIRSGEQLL